MAITKARMQVKRGNESDFDPSQMLPGEWAVSLDTKYVRMCFAPGICVRMATYDAFEADMEEIRDILLEAQTIQEAVARIQTEINDTAVVVEDYSILSKSYAVGGTGKRENEDSDNAKYYYEQTKQISQGINGIVPMGTVAFADLPNSNIVNNAMYNVSDAFTSDARFNDGGGIYYGPGNNVIWTAEGKWDVTASSSVTGIKGSAESAYRVGNVNITPSNIGLGNVNNTSDADKPISTATQAAIDALNGSLEEILDSDIKVRPQSRMFATSTDTPVVNITMDIANLGFAPFTLYLGDGTVYYVTFSPTKVTGSTNDLIISKICGNDVLISLQAIPTGTNMRIKAKFSEPTSGIIEFLRGLGKECFYDISYATN